MIIIVEFQLKAWRVSALAVSREWCVFLVHDMWTSTRWQGGRGSVSCGQGKVN